MYKLFPSHEYEDQCDFAEDANEIAYVEETVKCDWAVDTELMTTTNDSFVFADINTLNECPLPSPSGITGDLDLSELFSYTDIDSRHQLWLIFHFIKTPDSPRSP